jgi:hypothetical protein
MNEQQLPALPAASMIGERRPAGGGLIRVPAYTADQMREYAKAAIAMSHRAPAGASKLCQCGSRAADACKPAVVYGCLLREAVPDSWRNSLDGWHDPANHPGDTD